MKNSQSLNNKLCYETVIVNGVNTEIPIEISNDIEMCLGNIDKNKWRISPMLIDPFDLSIVFGIDENNEESKSRYIIKISKKIININN